MHKIIIYGEEARKALKTGIDKVADAVKVTLGPGGRNALIKQRWGLPVSTKDGVTVAREIVLEDLAEDAGAQLCKQVANKTNDTAGDGTTTATVLAQALIDRVAKKLGGSNAVEIKRGLDKAASQVEAKIKEIAKKISADDLETLSFVATIAGNDEEVGKIVAEAFQAVGKDGVVSMDDSRTARSYVDLVDGMQYDRGWISPYFMTSPERQVCELENPVILLWERRITDARAFMEFLATYQQAHGVLSQSKRPLLVVCDDLEGDALATLVVNKMEGRIQAAAVKAPGFGERRKGLMQDLAVFLGATFFSEEMGKDFKSVSISDLGSCLKVKLTAGDITFYAEAENPNKAAIDKHIVGLKEAFNQSDSKTDKEKLTERIAKLAGKVAIVRVGGSSDIEVREKKYRFEDAINATRAALEEGVVPGGGLALVKVREATHIDSKYPGEVIGANALYDALEVPLRTILENASLEASFESFKNSEGYDVHTGRVVKDMIKHGVMDPAKVTRSAVQYATSIAGAFLTTECLVLEAEEKGDKQ